MPAKAAEKTQTQNDDEVYDDLFSIPTVLEPDTYMIKFAGLRRQEWEGENKFNPGKPNVSIMWKFQFARIDEDGNANIVLDENTGEPYENEQATSTSMSERSTAYKWATAFLRHVPTADEVKRLSQVLKGKKAMAVVGLKDNGFPKIVDMFPYMGK